jgi:hypothetical protein
VDCTSHSVNQAPPSTGTTGTSRTAARVTSWGASRMAGRPEPRLVADWPSGRSASRSERSPFRDGGQGGPLAALQFLDREPPVQVMVDEDGSARISCCIAHADESLLEVTPRDLHASLVAQGCAADRCFATRLAHMSHQAQPDYRCAETRAFPRRSSWCRVQRRPISQCGPADGSGLARRASSVRAGGRWRRNSRISARLSTRFTLRAVHGAWGALPVHPPNGTPTRRRMVVA